MLGLTTVCGLCLLSGYLIKRHLWVETLLERILVVCSTGAAQLLLSIQVLSVPRWLTGAGLVAANAILTGMTYSLCRGGPTKREVPFHILLVTTWERLKKEKPERVLVLTAMITLFLILASWALGVALIPFGDGYHYDKPLFWRQHHTILPFPAPNPRIAATSFASEALTLPGYIFLHTDKLGAAIALPAALLCVWLVFAISRHLGCSFTAAWCSSLLTVGLIPFVGAFISMSTEVFLAMLWSGASILYLLKAGTAESPASKHLGWALFYFVMACGAKNTVILSAPLVVGYIVLKFSFPEKLWRQLILIGLFTLLCSGVIWNYASNKLWFGNFKGPQIMQEHTARDYSISSVWTRLCRGSILYLFDTSWIPASQQERYAEVCAGTLHLLGAQERLGEDNGYYGLSKAQMAPKLGLGLLGTFVFLPGVVLGLRRSIVAGKGKPSSVGERRQIRLLVVLTVGSFVLAHLVLRWPCIGHFRIMPFFLMAGAPLSALILDRKTFRIAGLILLTFTTAIFLRIDVKRHLGWKPEGLILEAIFSQSRSHETIVDYTWAGDTVHSLSVGEGHVDAALYSTFVSGVKTPAVIGYVGDMGENANASLYHLFGKDFANRIVPLTDTRTAKLLSPSPEMTYIVYHDFGSGTSSGAADWCVNQGYLPVFQATIDGKRVLTAFKRSQHRSQQQIGRI